MIFLYFFYLNKNHNGNVKMLLTSGSVDASVTQAQIHVIKCMASFVIFPGF